MTKVLSVEKDRLHISYMSPYGSKWKWENEDLGYVLKDCVLTSIRAPKQVGKLWVLTKKDEKNVTKIFQKVVENIKKEK